MVHGLYRQNKNKNVGMIIVMIFMVDFGINQNEGVVFTREGNRCNDYHPSLLLRGTLNYARTRNRHHETETL